MELFIRAVMEEEEEEEGQRRGGAMEGFMAEKASVSDCAFVWDEDSKLYFHARFGFAF